MRLTTAFKIAALILFSFPVQAQEVPANSAMIMDRGLPLGNELDIFSRRALHTIIGNKSPIPVDGSSVTQPVSQGTIPWQVSQFGTWTTGRTWTLGFSTDSITSRMQDGSGNGTTSQVNGSQRALDIGIDVGGSQIDPRSIRALTASDIVTADQGGAWTTGRTWSLLNSTDSVNAFQGGTWTVQQGTPPWSVAQSGSWTTGRTWSLSNTADSVASVQSGAWSTGRTWTLLNSTDSITAFQGTSPWVTSRNWTLSSGTDSVTSNIGTTGGLALDATVSALQVSQGSTTSGQKGGLALGAVTTGSPSYTNAQSSPLSLTTAGALRTDASATVQPASQSGTWTTGRTWSLLNSTDSVNSVQSGSWTTGRTWTLASGTDSITAIQGTSPWVSNITQFGGIALSTGTGASGTGIPRVTVSNDSNVLSTQSGTWTMQQGGTPTTIANAWPIKLTDGTNTTAVKAASTAALATDPSAVVALSPNSPLPTGTNNVGSITNVTGTVSLPTGAATSALQTTGNTTLSTISTAQTSGAQKTQVVDGSGVVEGPMMANNGVNHAPVYLPLDVTQGSVNVTVQDTASTSTAGFAGQSLITGTPTVASTAAYSLNSIQTVMVLISGTWTGTLSTEVSEDGGTTWESRSVHVVGTSTFASAVTANMTGSMNASAKTNVRIRATAVMTGTAAIKIVTSDNPSNMYVANALRLVDGSSTPNINTLTIKSASTPAIATDTAAVVAISPGTPISTKTALTANSPFTISVGVASGVYLALNASRKGLCTVNTSNATVSFGLAGAAAVLNSGITLYPGGTWCMDEYTFTTGAINAIAGTAASAVAGQEFQ